MQPATLVLSEAVQTVLDANGHGIVRIGPSTVQQTWVVTLATVSVSSNAAEPVATLYLNSKAIRLGGTFTGSNDVMGPGVTLRGGSLVCEWTGGDPGAVATLTVSGSMFIRGRL